jgi:hypothetical protein
VRSKLDPVCIPSYPVDVYFYLLPLCGFFAWCKSKAVSSHPASGDSNISFLSDLLHVFSSPCSK